MDDEYVDIPVTCAECGWTTPTAVTPQLLRMLDARHQQFLPTCQNCGATCRVRVDSYVASLSARGFDDEDSGPQGSGVLGCAGTLAGAAAGVLATWWTVIAFIGGRMPIIGYQTDGGAGPGLFWLFIVEPITVTVMYWATMIVLSPLIASEAVRSRRRHR